MCQDPLIQQWFSELPSPYRRADAEAFVGELVPQGWADDRPGWAIRDREFGKVCGMVTVAVAGDGEVGFWMGADWRNRGWTTRAVRLVAAAAFEHGADHLRWRALVGNDASRRVATKVGFRFDGTVRRAILQRGVWRDAWVATLLPHELL